MKVRFYSEMRTRVDKWIDKYNMLHDGDTVVVGVSGGADSVCLLFLLCEYAASEIYDIKLQVVHVNHMLRETANRDEEFVKDLCSRLSDRFNISIPCKIIKADIESISKEKGMSIEEAGRLVRYDAMRQCLVGKAGKIAVAHHANDRAETMLFNLFRGTGLNGVSGIKAVNDDIIRPLLCVTRKDIEKFVNENNLYYVTDETNLTDEYTRNKIRHNIIEYAEENIFAGAVLNMNNAAEQFILAEDFINECTLKASLHSIFFKEPGHIIIDIKELIKEHDYIIDRVLYDAVVCVANKKKDITSEHIHRIKLLLDATGSKEINLPYGVIVLKEYNSLIFTTKVQEVSVRKPEDYPIDMRVLTDFDILDIPKDNYTKWFDYDKISSVATVRFRKEGDYLMINKECQTKSLQDYFVNEKVPKEKRDEIPLLADKNHIMWVVGKRISEYYKVTEDTKRVLEVKIDI